MGCVGRGGRGVASRPGRRKLRCESWPNENRWANLKFLAEVALHYAHATTQHARRRPRAAAVNIRLG